VRSKENGACIVRLPILVAAIAAFAGCAGQRDSVKDDGTSFTVLVSKTLRTGETGDVTRLLPSESYLSTFAFWEASMHKTGRQLLGRLNRHVREKLVIARKEAADRCFDWNTAELICVHALLPVPYDKHDEEAEKRRMAYASVLSEDLLSEHTPISDLLPLMEGFRPDCPGTQILFFQFQDSDYDAFVAIHTIQAEGRRVVEPMFAFIRMYELLSRR